MGKLMLKQSFFKKLLMSFMLTGVLPVIILGFFAHSFTYSLPIKKLEQESLTKAKVQQKAIEEMAENYKAIISQLSQDVQLQSLMLSKNFGEYDNNFIYQKMYTLLSGRINDVYVYVIGTDGDFMISTVPGVEKYDYKKYKDWGIFRKLKENKEAFVYPNRYNSIDGKNISMSVAKSILVNGEVIGYIILEIPRTTVEKTLSSNNSNLEMNYMIFDDNFYIMYDDILKNDSQFFTYDFRYQMLEKDEDLRIVKINGRSYLFCTLSSSANGLILLAEVPVQMIIENNKYIAFITTLMIIISIIFSGILALIVTNRITNPIKKVVQAMKKVEKGDLNTKVEIAGNDEIGYMSRRFNVMVENLNELFKTNMEKQERLRIAEIKYLQAQINPHFLYNTLDSIKWLAKLNGVDEISIIVSKLGNLLKNSINSRDDLVTVEDSMYLIDSYLSIQKIRFGDKFEAFIDVDKSIMKCLVPKLVIQPVVENAIIHGIENKMSKGTVRITGTKVNDTIIFEISDDGIGISKEKLKKLKSSVALEKTSESIALSNISSRIKLYYGEEYGLEIFSEVEKGTRVRLVMPVNMGCTIKEDKHDFNSCG